MRGEARDGSDGRRLGLAFAQRGLAIVAALLAVGLAEASPRGADLARPTAPLPALRIDVNTASPEVLTILPNAGPTLVGRLVEARAERPFVSLADLDARVKGVGPKTIAQWRPYLSLAENSPMDPTRPMAPARSRRAARRPNAR